MLSARQASWFKSLGLFLAVLLLGTVYGTEAAGVVARAYVWGMLLTSSVVLFSEAAVDACRKFGARSVPLWVDASANLLIGGLLFAYGWLWTLLAYALHMLLMVALDYKIGNGSSVRKQSIPQSGTAQDAAN